MTALRTVRALDDLREHLTHVAARFGTPAYVLDVESLTRAAADIEDAFPRPWVWQYSLKANDLPGVVAVLASRGWGANVVSSGEWQHARAADVPAARTTVEGIGKTDRDLQAVISAAAAGTPIRWLSVESAGELRRLAELVAVEAHGSCEAVSIDVLARLNPQVQPETVPVLAVGLPSSKFGMEADEIRQLAEIVRATASPGTIRLRGLHVHIGSDLGAVAAWAKAGRRALELLDELRPTWPMADTVDFGGGFPAAGGRRSPHEFHDALLAELADARLELPPVCAIEPGRSLVGAAGWLLSSVLHSRTRPPHAQQVVLDTGMTELIRPALYGSHHSVSALGLPDAGVTAETELLKTAVEGPICESTDSFGVHDLPELRRGDLVVLGEAGAYSSSFSSRYNGRPQPPEVMVWPDGTFELGERSELVALHSKHPRASSPRPDHRGQPERNHA